MLKKLIKIGAFLVACAPAMMSTAFADSGLKPRVYDGIITQINMADGSFVLRLRDGRSVIVESPLASNIFVSLKGVLDPTQGSINRVSEFKIKSATSSDAIPVVSSVYPGSGQVGVKVTLTGTGFTKNRNTISIGNIKNALIDLASKDGKIVFTLPITPCNQAAKLNCGADVLAPGSYNIVLVNENGVSNAIPFLVNPPLPLSITTEALQQVVAGTKYKAIISGAGGIGGYRWSISDGKLPPGMAFVPVSCSGSPCAPSLVLLGAPTTPGVYPIKISLFSGREIVERRFSITVVQPINGPMYQ